MCEQPEGKEQHTGANMDPEVVDRLLKFLGFSAGVATAIPVSVEDVLAAVANNKPLSQADQAHIKRRLTLSISTVAQWSNARHITPVLCKLAINAEIDIKNERVKKHSIRSRAYTIIQT
jgi:hypothetical protein